MGKRDEVVERLERVVDAVEEISALLGEDAPSPHSFDRFATTAYDRGVGFNVEGTLHGGSWHFVASIETHDSGDVIGEGSTPFEAMSKAIEGLLGEVSP